VAARISMAKAKANVDSTVIDVSFLRIK